MRLRILWCIAFVALAAASVTRADTYVVAPDGSGDFETIQAAVDFAASGDTVLVKPGLYSDCTHLAEDGGESRLFCINLKSGITILGETGNPEDVVVDANQEGSCVAAIYVDGATIYGVTFTSGSSTTMWNGSGGGLYAVYSAVALERCRFLDNESPDHGGGIHAYRASLLLNQCDFEGNNAGSGGAMYVQDSFLTALSCNYTANSSSSRGGAIFFHSTEVQISDCWIDENQATDFGGGLVADGGSDINIERTVFLGNSADAGGAIRAESNAMVTISLCSLVSNSSSSDEACVSVYWSTVELESTTIAFNNSLSGSCDQALITASCCDLFGNLGQSWGGCLVGQLGINGNIQQDPQFCDYENGDLSLTESSPCAGENNPTCGQIGALPVGCGPQPGSLPFYEDFDDGFADGFEAIIGEWEVIDGTYRCFNDDVGSKHFSVVGDATWTDYRFEVDIATYGSDFHEIMVRYQPAEEWYLLTIKSNPWNEIFLHKMSGGTQTQLVHVPDFYNENETWHNLAVEVEGEQITAYFDDEQLFTYADQSDPLLAGGIGLVSIAFADVGWQYAHFDNVAVTSLVPVPHDEPIIESITDVGNDQGRNVRLVWEASDRDDAGANPRVTGYAIYRRQDEYKSAPPISEQPLRLEGWDFIESAPALGEEFYQLVAPTLCDSTDEGICWSVFKVIALTDAPLVFYESAPDSGYSIDNLAPEAPANPRMDGWDILAWDHVEVEDFDFYSVYVSESEDFSEYELVAQTTEDNLDVTGTEYQYLSVAATDFNGNEGELSAPVYNETPVDAPDVTRFALRQNVPNPFNPQTTIRYDLPQDAPVSLTIYDVAGREVRRLVGGVIQPRGRHEAAWNGTDDAGRAVATGVYFYRLEAGGYTQTRRMTLVR